jgi:hypothetical protein
VLAVIAQHGDCFASSWTMAREAGCRDIETFDRYVDDLIRVAAVERVIVRDRETLRAIRSDGPQKPYVKVHRAWMEHYVANRDIWSVCSRDIWKRGFERRGRRPSNAGSIDPGLGPVAAAVFLIIMATAAGRSVFFMPAKGLAANCGLSDDQFRRIVRLLGEYGLVDCMAVDRNTRWSVPQLARGVHEPQKSPMRVDEPQKSGSTPFHEPQKSGFAPVHEPQKSEQEVEEVLKQEEQDQSQKQGGSCARKSGERPSPHFSGSRTESKTKTTEEPKAPRATLPGSSPAITAQQLSQAYRECYERKFGAACPWYSGDDMAAQRTIERLPQWGPDEFERCFENLFASKDGRPTKKASFVLRNVHEYIHTPLNRFSRPLEWKDLSVGEQLRGNQASFSRQTRLARQDWGLPS